MKKTIQLLAIAAIATASLFGNKAKAQSLAPPNKWRFGIGIEGAIPTGNLTNYSNGVLGGTLRLQYGLTKHTMLMLTSGFYNAFGKNIPYTNNADKYQSLGLVPVKLGAKLYLGTKIYVSGEAGAAFETKANYLNNSKDVKLDLSPGLGYSMKHIDIGARYESISGKDNNYGIAALRIAYGFGL